MIVEERSQIAEVRRATAALAATLGFDEEERGRLAIAVTETASNIVKHAGRGRMLARAIGAGNNTGVEIVAVDQGPGIDNVAAGMADGYSTSGTPGNGLGSIARMTSNLEIYSQADKGTCVRFEVWPDGRAKPALALETGVVTIAKSGETECGDTSAIAWHGARCNAMIADGLGHGPLAAAASQAAAAVLCANPQYEAAQLIEAMHEALLSTRGGAVAVATLDSDNPKLKYCGVGNISGVVQAEGKARHLVSHNGTVGHNARRIQQFECEFPRDALLVMHSDGLATHWALDDYPGLAAKHPGVIAATLYRDHNRGRDDVSVLVVRNRAS